MAFGTPRIPKHLILDNYQYRPRKRRVGWAWLSLSITIVIISMLLATMADAQTTSEVEAGKLFYRSDNGNTQEALHLDTAVEAKLSGLIAQVSYVQTFINNSDDWREGIYKFPLPENAAVNYMEIRIGERRIIGEIKEKQEARKIYHAALQQGKRAALTEQQRPNFFTQKIANIGPHEKVEITLRYLHRIEYDAGVFEWRLPTTFTPRYIPGTPITPSNTNSENNESAPSETALSEIAPISIAPLQLDTLSGWALPTMAVPDAHEISPPMFAGGIALGKRPLNSFSLKILLDSGLPLASIDALFHDINVHKKSGFHEISLKGGSAAMDRDFSLQWAPSNSSLPRAAVFNEEIDGESYALLMMLPPQQSTENTKLSRDIVFIIDTSGSMQGTSIVQAKESLRLALQRLTPQDRFNIIEFNSDYSSAFTGLQHADLTTIENARNWVDGLQANGGTEMLSALNAAFESIDGSEQLQQIIFITDGAVGNESQLFKSIHNNLNGARLFTVGIGSAPNSYFMRKAAEFGRGSFIHIGDYNHVATQMSDLFRKLENAVSTDITINWNGHVEQYPELVGDVYLGEPLIVSAKLDSSTDSLTISGRLADREWSQTIDLEQNQQPSTQHSGVSQLWARAKIEQIEDKGITGTLNQDTIKQLITELALNHKLISRFTSFIAVEEERSRPKNHASISEAIANQKAQGQNLQPVHYPQTATSAEVAWWFGLFSFMCFVLVRRMSGEEK